MSDDDDDYLSDKFLVDAGAKPSASATYADLRKEAHRKAQLKNEQNRKKSMREVREEGLSKSLFERAEEENEAGLASGNKALSMMMKMGFKPGQALGRHEEEDATPSTQQPEEAKTESPRPPSPSSSSHAETQQSSKPQHRIEPLPLLEWEGRKGIGAKRRAPSPAAAERVAKMAKMAEDSSHTDFRGRSRQAYEEKRAEGRLAPAQRTCITLDEKAGKTFNVLWLDPKSPDRFPPGLLEALNEYASAHYLEIGDASSSDNEAELATRLRRQMQADALQRLDESDDEGRPEARNSHPGTTATVTVDPPFAAETLQETTQFLRLQARDRLELVLSYLRDRYLYCFWCGTEYDDEDTMENECPGTTEEEHD